MIKKRTPWAGASDDLKAKRTNITRAALETAIANVRRSSDRQCNGFVGVIVERIEPTPSVEANRDSSEVHATPLLPLY
jgi:hypothetical protein